MLSAGMKWNTARFSSYYQHKAYYGHFVRAIETVFILNRLMSIMSIVTGTKLRNANISFYLLCLFAISEKNPSILQTGRFQFVSLLWFAKGNKITSSLQIHRQLFLCSEMPANYLYNATEGRKCLNPQSTLSNPNSFPVRQLTKVPQ